MFQMRKRREHTAFLDFRLRSLTGFLKEEPRGKFLPVKMKEIYISKRKLFFSLIIKEHKYRCTADNNIADDAEKIWNLLQKQKTK